MKSGHYLKNFSKTFRHFQNFSHFHIQQFEKVFRRLLSLTGHTHSHHGPIDVTWCKVKLKTENSKLKNDNLPL